jgi:ribosomal protein S1
MENHNSMAEMMEQIEESLKIPRRGSIVKGSIIQVNTDVIIVNIGYKSDGVIPRSEVTADSSMDLQKNFKEGDELDVFVVSHDNGEGNILLSLRKVNIDKDWEELENINEKDEPIMVNVTDSVNGGLIAFYKEIRGFIPASQLSDRFVKNLRPYVGQSLKVKVIEINKQKRRAVFSHKEYAILEKQAQREAFWKEIEVGKVVEGEVKRITNFGAFVDIGGMDGLVHVTEMSWGRIKPASEFVKVGDKVNVKIIDLNQAENKISLSIKQLTDEPWSQFEEKYSVDGVYEGKVVNLTDFGAFVELEPGIEGLVHVSHIAKEHVEKPADVLRVNQVVEVKILEYVSDEKKVKLSMKAVNEPVVEEVEAVEVEAETSETIESTEE